jgi:hypothetical protein
MLVFGKKRMLRWEVMTDSSLLQRAAGEMVNLPG